ncbi:hypothetical protein BDR07DRAFT_1408300 [Suillus spraguei]|nr:hypothetical protein BDR07DRAFT_1408300 [Suillus spraguei]
MRLRDWLLHNTLSLKMPKPSNELTNTSNDCLQCKLPKRRILRCKELQTYKTINTRAVFLCRYLSRIENMGIENKLSIQPANRQSTIGILATIGNQGQDRLLRS